jgi:AraC-like DNA-binding protein
MMPEIDGLTLLRMIRETPSTEDIPFILLTAKSDEDNRLAGYSEKADAYITKPFHANELIIRISNLLNNRKRLEGKLGRKIIAIDLESDTYEQADQAFLANVKETILKELANSNFTIKQLAESVFLSERQFRRKLNSLTGLSPLDFIRQIRLLHARALIENKVFDTIAEVAAAVGFNNPAYFSRLYKKLYGHPPNAPDEESSVSS